MAPTVKVFSDYCRLCAVEAKNGVIIYSLEGETLCLEEKIIQCLRIEVSKNDLLPKKVCRPCRSRLEDYHRFAERASQVQHTLKQLLQDCALANDSTQELFKDADLSCVQIVHTEIGTYANPYDDHELNSLHVHNSTNDNEGNENKMLIKEEFLELPLDVTLEMDSNNHVDLGEHNTGSSEEEEEEQEEDEEEEGEEEDEEEVLQASKTLKRVKASSRPIRQTRRRKMLQPKKAAKAAATTVPKRRGRPPRQPVNPPSASSGEEEVADFVEELDEINDEDLDDRDIDELNLFKGLREGVKIEGEDGLEMAMDDETDQKAKEEWKTHWGIKCNQCEQLFPFKSHFDKHYRLSYDKKPAYTCSYCNKTMEKYSTFRSHCYRHVTEGRYRCEYCQKGFSLRSMLHVHVLAKHTAVKPFICEECGKGFVTRPGLNIHLRKHRAEEACEFPCADCGKVLHTRGGLTAHMNVHKLGRRFMCDVCGKTFTQKVNMQQHVKHHTGERPFACEKCGKCFAEKSHLNRHYSFHSETRPFQCKVCFKMYKTERCLKVHAMVHAEARPYVCTYCSKGFLSTTKLKQHNNIHTGERPYACKYCDRTFTNYPNWLKHTRRRHKADPRAGMGTSRESGLVMNHHQDQNQLPPHHLIHQDSKMSLSDGHLSLQQTHSNQDQLQHHQHQQHQQHQQQHMLHHESKMDSQRPLASFDQSQSSSLSMSAPPYPHHQPLPTDQAYADHIMLAMQMQHPQQMLPL